MATHAADHTSDYIPGEMPIQEQTTTFHGVIGLMKWGSVALAAFLTLLVFWFCTPAGFFPGFVVAAIIVVLSVVFLREKTDAAH